MVFKTTNVLGERVLRVSVTAGQAVTSQFVLAIYGPGLGRLSVRLIIVNSNKYMYISFRKTLCSSLCCKRFLNILKPIQYLSKRTRTCRFVCLRGPLGYWMSTKVTKVLKSFSTHSYFINLRTDLKGRQQWSRLVF